MASDILVGVILGLVVLGLFNPLKGIVWTVFEQRKQIAFLSGQQKPEVNRKDDRDV